MDNEAPLGIKEPLLPPKPLGNLEWQSQSRSPVVKLDTNIGQAGRDILLSPYGKSTLNAITEIAEEDIFVNRSNRKISALSDDLNKKNHPNQLGKIETKTSDITVSQVLSEGKESLPVLTVVDSLTCIKPLPDSSFLGEKSLKTLQVLPIIKQSELVQQINNQSLSTSPTPQNLAKLSLLSSTKAKNSNQQAYQPSQKSLRDIPTSWSSIAELIGEIPTQEQQLSTFQESDDEFEEFIFTPEGFHKINSHQMQPLDYSDPIVRDRTNPSNKPASLSNSLPQSDRQSPENPETTVEITSPYAREEEIVSEANLEILAHEVYKFVRQRLEIERERRGRF